MKGGSSSNGSAKPQVPPTHEEQVAHAPEQKTRPPDTATNRGLRLALLAVAIAVIVLTPLLILHTVPLCDLTIVIGAASETVHFAVYLDGNLMDIDYVSPEDDFIKSYKLTRGTHTVGLDWCTGEDHPDGAIELLKSFEIVVLHPQTMRFEIG